MTIRIAAIGITHSHIYGQVDCLLRAGADLVAFQSGEDEPRRRILREISAGKARGRPPRNPRG